MDPGFWHKRWEEGQIGFHKPAPNPRLVTYWDAAGVAPGARVLVPLCGKSVDLWWLAARGLEVVGVEVSPVAVEALFREAGVAPERTTEGALERWTYDAVTVWVGDFFAFRERGFAAVYDRAAFVALPPDRQAAYVAHVAARLAPGARGLLVAIEHSAGPASGPPFSTDDAAVRAAWSPRFALEALGEQDVLDEEPRFRARGLTSMVERVYRVVRSGEAPATPASTASTTPGASGSDGSA